MRKPKVVAALRQLHALLDPAWIGRFAAIAGSRLARQTSTGSLRRYSVTLGMRTKCRSRMQKHFS